MSIKVETYDGYPSECVVPDIKIKQEDLSDDSEFPPVITKIKEEKIDSYEEPQDPPAEPKYDLPQPIDIAPEVRLEVGDSFLKTESLSEKDDSEEEEEVPLTMPHILKAFPCSHCKKVYSTRYDLNAHILNTHSPQGPVEHKCYHCGGSFQFERNLKNHIRNNHLGGQTVKYVCHQCDRTYSDRNSLIYHMEFAH